MRLDAPCARARSERNAGAANPTVNALTPQGGLWIVKDERELATALARLLGDAAERERRAAAALAAAEASRGAARRAVHQLVAWNLWPVAT